MREAAGPDTSIYIHTFLRAAMSSEREMSGGEGRERGMEGGREGEREKGRNIGFDWCCIGRPQGMCLCTVGGKKHTCSGPYLI